MKNKKLRDLIPLNEFKAVVKGIIAVPKSNVKMRVGRNKQSGASPKK